ncbi:MAG: HEAT repeat domain-containing protein [Saprospiraceae bacterium]|nr:HEAT repeat domain-containing protein [Saprospiraceae bacterium]
MIAEPTYQLFTQVPGFLRLMILIIILLSTAVIFLIIYLQLLRARLRTDEMALSKFKLSFEEMIIQYLLSGDDPSSKENGSNSIFYKLLKATSKKFSREVLVKALIELHRNVTGNLSEKVRKLYAKLDLTRYALKKLKSWHWTTVIKGIHELSEMQVEQADARITALINHRRLEVRSEAQLYKASVFNFRGLEFLNNLQSSMSEWQQIQLLEGIRHGESEYVPNISVWLRSPNRSVVSFALKLAEIYNLVELQDSLLPLLKHEDINIRIKTISVLAHLGIYACKDLIRIHFDQKKIQERIAIVKAIAQLVEPNDLPLLQKLAKAPEFEIRRTAILVLRQFIPETENEQEDLLESTIDSKLVTI